MKFIIILKLTSITKSDKHPFYFDKIMEHLPIQLEHFTTNGINYVGYRIKGVNGRLVSIHFKFWFK